MSNLKLASHLSVPRTIAARTIFVAGTKGSGKTHNAGVLAEEMLDAGTHIVVLDPLGVWFGLRHDRDGGPGGFPIVILGGEHGDAPLEPTSGEIVAEYIVRSGQSVILDMSGFAANAEQDRFVAAFLLKLFRLKATEKANLHLIMDEADMFVPQEQSRGQETLIGAAKTIVTKGRSRGLSMTMITQRPQSIAKAAIEEADVVLCHRMTGKRAVDAMKSWTDLYATKEQAARFYETLPQLEDGQCWVWSPQFLKAFERHKFRLKKTFDSSRTPEPGERRSKPKAAAAVDLAKLTAEIKATMDKAKADDPKLLKKRIAELEKALNSRFVPPPAAKAETKIVEKPVIKAEHVHRLEKLGDALIKAYAAVVAKQGEFVNAAEAVKKLAEPVRTFAPPAQAKPVAPQRLAPPIPKTSGNYSQTYSKPAATGERVSSRQQKFLDAAATLTTLGTEVTRETVAAWVGVHPRGGSVGEVLSALVDAGYIASDRGRITVTEAGMAAAGSVDPSEAIERAKSGLTERQRKFFTLIADAYPDEITREQIAEAFQLHPRGGSLGEDLSRLVGRGLVTGHRGSYKARSFLFAGSN
jgi:signal recognition particle GTPase